MQDYLVQKFMKEQEQKNLARGISPTTLKNKPGDLSPNKSSMKEEFLKSYIAMVGETRHDRNLTLSWINKQAEKRRKEKFLSLNGKGKKDLFIFSNNSSPRKLPAINQDGGSPTSKMVKRIATEPTSFEQSGAAVANIKAFFLKKYAVKSSRIANYSCFTQGPDQSSDVIGVSQFGDSLSLSQAWKNRSPDLSESGVKVSVRKELEEVYSKDFEKIKHQLNSASGSSYANNRKLEGERVSTSLHRVDRKIGSDKVLMGRFKNPYAENMPFSKPINASIRNEEDSRVMELQVKSQILKNLKSLEENLGKDMTVALENAEKNRRSKKGVEEEGRREMSKMSAVGKSRVVKKMLIPGNDEVKKNRFYASSIAFTRTSSVNKK